MPAPPPFPTTGGLQIGQGTAPGSAPPPPMPTGAPAPSGGAPPPPMPTSGGMVLDPAGGAPGPAAPTGNGAPSQGGWMHQYGEGDLAGVHDVFDWPAEKLASGVGALAHAVGLGKDWHPGEDLEAADDAAAQQFKATYSSSPAASIGRGVADAVGTAAEIAGGEGLLGEGATAAAPMLGDNGAAVIGNLGRFLNGNAPGGLLAKGASKVAQGAVSGAAANALMQGQAGPSLGAAKQGAEFGAVAGPVLGVAGGVAGALGKGAKQLFGSVTDIPAVVQRQTATDVTQLLAKDGMTPAQAVAAVRQMGPHATLADVGGENVKQAARALAKLPGTPSTLARNTFDDRSDNMEGEVTQAIQRATGQPGNTYEAGQDLKKQRSDAAKPLYDNLKTIIPTQDQLDQVAPFLAGKRGQQAIKGVLDTIEDSSPLRERIDPAAVGLGQDENGNYFIQPGKPSLPLLHAIKEGFDDMVEGNRGTQGALPGQMPKTKPVINLNGLRGDYRDTLTSLFPQYKAALDAWSGDSASLDAQNFGINFLKQPAEVTAAMIKNQTPNERAFFLNGVARTLIDMAEGNADSASDARAVFKNTKMRNKLQAAFPSQAAYDDFAAEMQKWIAFADNKSRIMGGSQTAETHAAMDALKHTVGPVIKMATGDIFGAARDVAVNHLQKNMTPADSLNAAKGQLFFSPDAADDLQKFFERNQPGSMRALAGGVKSGAARAILPGGEAAWNAFHQPGGGGGS